MLWARRHIHSNGKPPEANRPLLGAEAVEHAAIRLGLAGFLKKGRGPAKLLFQRPRNDIAADGPG